MPEWIPVTERMPRNHRTVIIYAEGDGIDYGGWHTKEFGWLHSDGTQAEGVTHWRQRLKPPTKEAGLSGRGSRKRRAGGGKT